jgi:hypothetical protein
MFIIDFLSYLRAKTPSVRKGIQPAPIDDRNENMYNIFMPSTYMVRVTAPVNGL